jgi:hypothetical protein
LCPEPQPIEQRPCPFAIAPETVATAGRVYRGSCQDFASQNPDTQTYVCQSDQGTWVATNTGCDTITDTSVPSPGPGYNDPSAPFAYATICVEE